MSQKSIESFSSKYPLPSVNIHLPWTFPLFVILPTGIQIYFNDICTIWPTQKVECFESENKNIIVTQTIIRTTNQSSLWCININPSPSKYFVEPLLLQVQLQVFRVYRYKLCTSRDWFFFFQNNSSLVTLDGDHLWTKIIRFCLRFSNGLCLGFDCPILTIEALAAWLVSLSCCMVSLCSILKTFADCKSFSLRIILYLAPTSFLSTLSRSPVPVKKALP